jgi:hypothetical protein
MFHTFAIKVMPVLAGLGLTGIVIGSGQADPSTEPVRCEIEATSSSGMISLEGIVEADIAVSGTYEFRVVGSGHGGNSNIRQGGAFTAGPDAAVTLGRVMLGASGAVYDASLEVVSNGKTIECSERVGGTI